MADDNEDQGLLSLTTEIVASFVGNNPVAIGDLPAGQTGDRVQQHEPVLGQGAVDELEEVVIALEAEVL